MKDNSVFLAIIAFILALIVVMLLFLTMIESEQADALIKIHEDLKNL